MKLSELLTAVVTKTKRPDLEDDILLAVQEATLFLHQVDFFRRDLIEVPICYDTPTFSGRIDIGAECALPGFRKISYWRKADRATRIPVAGKDGFFSQVEPDALLDTFNEQKRNVYYLAGRYINWLSSSKDSLHLIGYWKNPKIGEGEYDSWIADYSPFPIIKYAAGIVFNDIGQKEVGAEEKREAIAMMQVLLQNEIETAGR